MSYLKDFLASIKEVKWFSQAGELPSACLLFDTRADAVEAAQNIARYTSARYTSADAAWNAAWNAAWGAAWEAAGSASQEAVENTAMDAARDASLVAGGMSAWNNPTEPNTVYALRRWSVWQAGFGCLCDIRGTLYCYRRVV